MSEQQAHTAFPETTPRIEPLTDERVGELLSAIGNHEGKAALMLAMRAGQSYDHGGLHALIEELPGAKGVYIGRRGNQLAYCRQSLQPIGMVTEIKPQPDGAVKYAVTEDGMRYGKPLAAALLKFGDKHDVALSTIFGATASRGVRSPFVRYRLAQEFVAADNLDVRILTEAIGLPRQMTRHLSSLALDGLVRFNQFEMERDEIAYEWVSPAGKFTARASQDVMSAVDYLEKHTTATLDQLVENYWQTLGPAEKQSTTIQAVRNHLNVHLKSLEQRRGCIRKVNSKWSDKFTKVELSEGQKMFWQELVAILEEFKTSGGADQPDTSSEDVLNDYGLIQRALERAYDQSPTANSGSLKDVGILALRAVKAADKPVTINEVVRLVKETTGRQIDRMTVAVHFKELEAAGRLVVKPGKARLYSIKQTTSQD